MTTIKRTSVKGDQFTQTCTVQLPDFDFSASTVLAQVRKLTTSTVLAEPTIIKDSSTIGTLVVVLTLTGEQTQLFPDRCYLELQVGADGEDFGPYTVLRVELTMLDDITRAA